MSPPTVEEAVKRLEKLAESRCAEAERDRRTATDVEVGMPDDALYLRLAEHQEADAQAIRTVMKALADHQEAIRPFAAAVAEADRVQAEGPIGDAILQGEGYWIGIITRNLSAPDFRRARALTEGKADE